jgi:hypothetical protein
VAERTGAGLAFAAALLVLAAGCAPRPPVRQMAPPAGDVVSSVESPHGTRLTLRVSGVPGDEIKREGRCWHLSETDGAHLQTVSACTTDDTTSVNTVLGAMVVVTTCRSATVAVGRDAESLTDVVPAGRGMLLLPPSWTTDPPSSVTVACVDDDGQIGPRPPSPSPRRADGRRSRGDHCPVRRQRTG